MKISELVMIMVKSDNMAESRINEEMWKDVKASRALLVVLGTPSHSWEFNEERERAEERSFG